ncbi:MAG: cytochrome c biogenesis protein ResB, partial [Nitrospiraceae bacterium]
MDVIEIVKKILISPKTAVSLIVLVLLSCLIGFFVPQIADKSPSFFEQWKDSNAYSYRVVDSLQLNRVFTSPWFLALVLMTALSLTYSLYRQVKRNVIHIRTQSADHRAQTEEDNTLIETGRGWINNVFKKRGYREDRRRSNGPRLVFSKNSTGRWGSIIFHAGLVLVIISALIVLCFQ